jgi:hypothetical protein
MTWAEFHRNMDRMKKEDAKRTKFTRKMLRLGIHPQFWQFFKK